MNTLPDYDNPTEFFPEDLDARHRFLGWYIHAFYPLLDSVSRLEGFIVTAGITLPTLFEIRKVLRAAKEAEMGDYILLWMDAHPRARETFHSLDNDTFGEDPV